MTCHLLFLYHTPYYQKTRTQKIWRWCWEEEAQQYKGG
ncbi:hypothetical protein RintRC_3865 [Richelia intracellularis]|nr:hypothetical protein RintRC_3865 [Richelia intracellularis]